MKVPQKSKNKTTIWSSNCTFGIYPEELIPASQKDIGTLMLITPSFTIAKKGKCGIYIQYYSVFKNEANSAICNNMDKPGGHYVKWNKPATEEQMHMASLT